MPRNVRSLVSDLLAIALGFAVVSASTAVLSAARATGRTTNTAPSVWLLSPGNSQAVTGTVTMSATASQDTEALQFQLNGGSLGPTITSGACSMNWNTAAVPDGSYTLTVVGYDALGNATTSSPATVNVENSVASISGISTTGITDTSAIVTWSTNQLSSSSVDYGASGYTNSTPLDVNLTTQHAVSLVGLLSGTTYHFRVASWNGVGLLATSNDFVFTTSGVNSPAVPTPPSGPAGCTTPDPFVALGGGLCVNGGWLPGGASFFQQAPTTPAPPVPSNGCGTPDPFTAIGGGMCVNGGWLPRNVVTPPAPLVAPVTAPTPPPVQVAPSNGACGTPDPFLALGGGTCFNGGWFPPGMLPAPGFVQPVTPPPAPSNQQGCATPDPFVTIPGMRGSCVNGGWYPVRIGG